MNATSITRAGEWLHRDAPVPLALTSEQMLALNADLPAPAKLVLAPNGEPLLRHDRPIDPDCDLEELNRAASETFERALVRLHGTNIATSVAGDAPPLATIAELCGEAGWQAVVRAARVTVDLDCAEYFQAELTPLGGGLAIRVEVAQLGAAGPEGVEAARVLLLRAGGLVRFARPVVSAGAARFEVLFSTQPTALEIGDALSALSIACRLAGRETALLAGAETIAREYLATLARSNPRGLHKPETEEANP